jgi:hypothetical protein
VYGAVARLEGALENKKPRQPREDRETLRGASLAQRRYEESLNTAYQECLTTIPKNPRARSAG